MMSCKRHITLAAAAFGFVGSPAAAVDVAALLGADRAVMAAEHAYCAAAYGVDVQRAGYLPSVDVRLSASDKTVDKTTRADAFGGEGSPEYDGHGLDAELTVSQTLYDWGKTGADVGIAKAQRRKQELAFTLAVQDSLAELVSGTLQYEAQSKAVAALRRNVQRLTVNRKAVGEQVRLGYKNRRVLNDYDLLLLDRKTLLAEARQKRQETRERLTLQYDMAEPEILTLATLYRGARPAAPAPIAAADALDVQLLDEDIRIAKHQSARLSAQAYPNVAARLSARGWDLDQNRKCTDIAPSKIDCSTHDVTGAVELSMPLFSGGARVNRNRAALARKAELQARRTVLLRRYEADNAVLPARFEALADRLLAAEERVALLEAQLKIERGRQKTNAIRFNVIADLDSRRADARVTEAFQSADLEVELVKNMHKNNTLNDVFEVDPSLPNCRETR